MARVVVVSSSKLDKEALWGVVSSDDELHVVVPAVKQSRLQWLTNDEGKARAEARAVGEAVAQAAPADASDVDVKPDPPQQVVRDAIARASARSRRRRASGRRGGDLARGGRP